MKISTCIVFSGRLDWHQTYDVKYKNLDGIGIKQV